MLILFIIIILILLFLIITFRKKIDVFLHRFDFYSNYKYEIATKKLKKQVGIKNVERNLLIPELIKEIARLRNIYGISEYIPHDHKSVHQVLDYMELHYGNQMRKYGITITKKLKINA
jgi:hypothetical protein